MRTLLLLRHAKSDYPAGVGDHDRPLAARGIREAGLAGDWLRAAAPPVDAVLCSTATRTRQTLERTGGRLVILSGRLSGKIFISVGAYQPGAENTTLALRELAARTLADFDLVGEIH